MVTRMDLTLVSDPTATEEEFEALSRAELPRVFNFFRYRVCDGALAEDPNLPNVREGMAQSQEVQAQLGGLFNVAVHNCPASGNRPLPDASRAEVSLDDLSGVAGSETTEDLALRRVDFERLAFLLARLGERERELVALKYGGGLTNRTIAGSTSLSESNVGVILHRTVQVLRAGWDNSHER